jgi:hypothetical protein
MVDFQREPVDVLGLQKTHPASLLCLWFEIIIGWHRKQSPLFIKTFSG